MREDGGKSWAREILVGIAVAVGSAIIIAWLGLQTNDRNRDNPVPPAPTPNITVQPRRQPDEIINIDLSGTWMEPSGNVVEIVQQGARVTLRMPYMEAMGIAPALTTQKGTVEESADRRYLTYVNASNG